MKTRVASNRRSLKTRDWQYILMIFLSYLFGDSNIPKTIGSVASTCVSGLGY